MHCLTGDESWRCPARVDLPDGEFQRWMDSYLDRVLIADEGEACSCVQGDLPYLPTGEGSGDVGAYSLNRPHWPEAVVSFTLLLQDKKAAPMVLLGLVACGILLPLIGASWYMLSSNKFAGPNRIMQV